jgi:lipase
VTPLFVSSFGTGRPILCLHGIESHGIRFLGLAQHLPGVRVVAPDLRGHGRSPMDGPWTLDQHARDLVPIIETLPPSAIVLGHSYGGLIAWELAGAVPDRVAALILVDPAIAVSPELAQMSSTQFSEISRRWPDHSAALEEMILARPPDGHWSAALDAAVATHRDAEGWLRPMVAPEAVHAGWQQMQLPMRPTAYRGRTLLLEAGRENGLYVSPAITEQMRVQLDGALTHAVLDATHTIPSDYPDLLAVHVGGVLQALGDNGDRTRKAQPG